MRKLRNRLLIVIVIFLVAAGIAGNKLPKHKPAPRPDRIQITSTAIAWASRQIGKPYVWGGPTLPGTARGFDCSGLTQEALAAAGIRIPRTSQQQWAAGHHVTIPRPGDLVYFHGYLTPGEHPPGHVGLIIGDHTMIEAYAVGTDVRISHFGIPGSPPGDETVWGYTDPLG